MSKGYFKCWFNVSKDYITCSCRLSQLEEIYNMTNIYV